MNPIVITLSVPQLDFFRDGRPTTTRAYVTFEAVHSKLNAAIVKGVSERRAA